MTKTKNRITVPVSHRALVGRINRLLAKEGQRLLVNRGAAAAKAFGRFAVVSGEAEHLYIHHGDIDLEPFARKAGALEPWERLDTEEGT